jgi:hypothetical protein
MNPCGSSTPTSCAQGSTTTYEEDKVRKTKADAVVEEWLDNLEVDHPTPAMLAVCGGSAPRLRQ